MKPARSCGCALLLIALVPASLASQSGALAERVARLERRVQALEDSLRDARRAGPSGATVAATASVHVRWGSPAGRGVFLDKEFFVISFDTLRLVPEWVSYHVTDELLEGTTRRTDDFRPDPDLPPGRRSELVDYARSGFDRGHLAPAADFKRSSRAMSATFLLSNMAPQTARLNQRIWARLEADVRSLARAHGTIWVIAGPLYLDEAGRPAEPRRTIGPNGVAVPTHFFKVILCEHEGRSSEMFAFVMPNSGRAIPGRPRDHLVSVDSVEALAGLDLFALLPDREENSLEATIATVWPVR